MKFRICVLNDFRQTHAVLDYKEYGVIKDTHAWIHEGRPFKHIYPRDSITIFLNYDQILDTKEKDAAIEKLVELLDMCPPHARSEYDVLFRAIDGRI